METIETRIIPLDLIDVDPDQPRQNKPEEYLRGLGESIKGIRKKKAGLCWSTANAGTWEACSLG